MILKNLGFNGQLVQAEEAAEAILEDVFSTPFSVHDRAHGYIVMGERWRDFFEVPNSKKKKMPIFHKMATETAEIKNNKIPPQI